MAWDPVLLALATSTPFWGAVVVGFALFLFREPLRDFIRRMTRVGAGKYAVEAPDKPPEQKPPPSPEENLLPAEAAPPEAPAAARPTPRQAADALLANLARNPYISAREAILTGVLETQGISDDPVEAQRVLTAIAASALVGLEFERIYQVIWGSQISILNDVNASRVPVPKEILRRRYNFAATLFPEWFRAYDFESYLRFLVNLHFIEERDGAFVITLVGGRSCSTSSTMGRAW